MLKYLLIERWSGLQGESRSVQRFDTQQAVLDAANTRGDALETDGWRGVPTAQSSRWVFRRDGETADLSIELE